MQKSFQISRTKRIICCFLALNLIFEIISPSMAFALTSGPAQEEFASFEPSTTTDMVDLYSGDFTYNIPLMSVPGPNGGYPINLAYHSGVGMEQEASWVGLGWSLNVGSINRQLRGLPDDFKGEVIKKRQHMKETWMVALDIPKKKYVEYSGIPTGGGLFNDHVQVYYNNYKGMGYKYLANFAFPNKGNDELASVGLNVGFDSQNGIDVEPKLSLAANFGKTAWSGGFGLGLSYNSRQGLQRLSFTSSLSNAKFTRKLNSVTRGVLRSDNSVLSSNFTYAANFNVPETKMQMKSTSVPFNLKIAKITKMKIPTRFPSKFPMLWSGYVNRNKMVNDGKSEFKAFGYMNDLESTQDNDLKDFSRDNLQYSKKVPNLPMSSFTYDMFSQSGQGAGSTFRAYQNQIHVLRDPEVISYDDSYDVEVEFGTGPGFAPAVPPFNVNNTHIGIGYNDGSGESRSGSWKTIKITPDEGGTLTSLKSKPTINSNIEKATYQDNYFKAYGEKTGYLVGTNGDQLSAYSNEAALRFEVEKEKGDNNFLNRHYKVTDALITTEGQNSPSAYLSARPLINVLSRAKRTNDIEYFTYEQAKKYGYSRNLQFFNTNNQPVNKFPTNPDHPLHHLSEISVLQADGMRYVYGLTSYNKKQVDNVFTSKNTGDFNTNTVDIKPGSIEGIDIKGTHDEYMERNEMPEYANGWMLTHIFSADYVDLTNNGPTEDDYGFWVKFNYTKVHDDYKWRTPYNKASFIEGYKNDAHDDKASYTYGEKEIFIIHSIESKTHLAKFITSDRKDAFEAAGELANSGMGAKTLKRLDKIQLYAKKDLAVNNTNATPVKVVNFVYSYELCPGVPNNNTTGSGATYTTNAHYDELGNFLQTNLQQNALPNEGGKLTLKQVYFTYQKSNRSQLSPYIFKYGNLADPRVNPPYERRNMDRWGNYSNNTGNYTGNNQYPYIDNPYTPQDNNFYDSNTNPNNYLVAGQWSMRQVFLPTGGVMNVDYDFDDYYYEENKKALRNFDIIGIGSDQGASRTGSSILSNTENTTLYFRLEEPCTTNVQFYQKYLANLPKSQVAYKVFAQIKGMGNNQTYDYVSGYGELNTAGGSYGVTNGGTIGFISMSQVPLSKMNISGKLVSPITRAIIEHLRVNRSEMVHNAVPYSTSAKAQILNVLSSVVAVFGDIKQAISGFNKWAYKSLYNNGNFPVRLNGYSTIRLCDPNNKIGGGIRVKKLTMVDNWKNGANNDISSYGQEYDYTTTNSNGDVISSGVAYEPQVGADESALRTAIKYAGSNFFKSDYNLFVETPIAKSYYPGESVGYSKVTVRSIGAQENFDANGNTALPKSNSAPISVYEFYTPKDFPVIVNETDNGPYSKPIYVAIPVLGLFSKTKRRHIKSQGYSVIVNDMAGKPKSTGIYTAKLTSSGNQVLSEPDKLVSKQNFIYGTKTPYNPNAVNELDNRVQTITVNQSYQTQYQTAVLGQTHDMFVDMNENSQDHAAFGIMGNLDLSFFAPAIPFVVPVPWAMPSYHETTNNLRTIVLNKIIYKSGILSKVETTSDKSTIVSENLAYDIETGQPILTKVTNEFKDPIYSFSFPAHWYYKNVGPAYRNWGTEFTNPLQNMSIASDGSGRIQFAQFPTNATLGQLFSKGDVLYIEPTTANPNATGLYHVFSIGSSALHCVNSSGQYYPMSTQIASVKIVRSGNKNMQNIQAGSLQFKKIKTVNNVPDFEPYDPAQQNVVPNPQNVTFDNPTDNKILNASAIELSDNWQLQCGNNYLQYSEPSLVCVPDPNSFSAMSGFMNYLSTSSNRFAKNVQVIQNNNPINSTLIGNNLSYLNGFSSNLMTIFKCMGLMESAPSISNGSNVYYHGFISPITYNYVVVFTNAPIPNNISDPNQLCVGYSSGGAVLFPKNGLVFVKPAAVSLNNSTAPTFWTNFLASNPSISSSIYFVAGGNGPCGNGIKYGIFNSANIQGYGSQIVNGYCNYCNSSYPGGPGPLNKVVCGECLDFGQICTYVSETAQVTCGQQTNQVVNPYQNGMKGIWRTKRVHNFNTSRTQNENVREDGILTSFVRFPWENPSTKDPNWIESNTVTKYNQQGFEVENKNPIGNFSAALFGYGNSLNTAVANNARYTDIGFDNFEDYPKACDEDHFSYSNYSANVTNTEAHTGKYSINVPTGQTFSVYRSMFTNCDANTVGGNPYVNDNMNHITQFNGQNVSHTVSTCDCIGKYAPQRGVKYVVSAWVKQKSSTPFMFTNYSGCAVEVKFFNNVGPIGTVNFVPTGNIIDGWQRISGEFTMPVNATSLRVDLRYISNIVGVTTYFDDVRVQPFDASMKTFVYDAITSKVMAELDDNNYATIYNYDDEGNLTKVKRETEKGIKTIKEGRVNSKKVTN